LLNHLVPKDNQIKQQQEKIDLLQMKLNLMEKETNERTLLNSMIMEKEKSLDQLIEFDREKMDLGISRDVPENHLNGLTTDYQKTDNPFNDLLQNKLKELETDPSIDILQNKLKEFGKLRTWTTPNKDEMIQKAQEIIKLQRKQIDTSEKKLKCGRENINKNGEQLVELRQIMTECFPNGTQLNTINVQVPETFCSSAKIDLSQKEKESQIDRLIIERKSMDWFFNLDESDKHKTVQFFAQSIHNYGKFDQNVVADMEQKFKLSALQTQQLYEFVYTEKSSILPTENDLDETMIEITEIFPAIDTRDSADGKKCNTEKEKILSPEVISSISDDVLEMISKKIKEETAKK